MRKDLGKRWPVALVTMMLIAAFGPYVASGIRTEQIAVYAICGMLALGLHWLRTPLPAPAALVIALLGSELLIAAIGLIQPPPMPNNYIFGSAISGLDNLLLPIAVILSTLWAARAGDIDAILRRSCSIVVIAAIINAGIAFLSSTVDLSPWLQQFWDNGSGISTAANAATNGRYSGIFNHPAEAGVFYSVGLLAAIYRLRFRPGLLVLATAAITVGGMLTASKVFLLVGLPAAMWQIFRAGGRRTRRIALLAGTTVFVWLATVSGILPPWPGSHSFVQFLDPGSQGRDAANLYTAGRFGSDSTLTPVIDTIRDNQPLFGYGAHGLLVAYDSGYVEALVMTGFVGLVCQAAAVAVMSATWWRRRRQVDSDLSRLTGGLLFVVVGGSMGIPALTANRVATVVWILLTLVLLAHRPTRDGAAAFWRQPTLIDRKTSTHAVRPLS